MIESILSDQMLVGIIGVILGIIASLIITYIAYRFAKREKKLFFVYKTEQLISGYKSTINDLSIKYKGKEIENLHLTKIVVWNRGKSTISEKDIASADPITLCINDKSKILSCEIVGLSNESIKPTIQQIDTNMITISFEYLNFKNGFVIQIFHTSTSDSEFELHLHGTIKTFEGELNDKKNLHSLNSLNNLMIRRAFVLVAAIFIAALCIGLLYLKASVYKDPSLNEYLSIAQPIVLISIMITMLCILLYYRLTKNRLIPKSLKPYI